MSKAKKQEDKPTKKIAKKVTPKKIAQRDVPLRINTTFENLLGMVINTPPKKKKK